jgi:hypothetical protein
LTGFRQPLRFVSADSVGEASGVEGSFRRARNHVKPTKTAQQMFQKVSIPFCFNKGWSPLVAGQFDVRSINPVTGKISQPSRALDCFIARGGRSRERSPGKGKLWMNANIAGHLVAILAWWRRNFQSAAQTVASAGATARNGNLSSCFSAADCFSVPAPTIPLTTTATRTVITATATDTTASKWKPSIVRVIRVRRRHPACEAFPG